MNRIDVYLKKHADAFGIRKNVNEKFFDKNNYLHFTISFSLTQFKNKKEACEKLKKLVNTLVTINMKVKEKNGWRVKKDGTKVQKYRERKVKIGEQIIAYAIHLKGHDQSWFVNPHAHLIFQKNARLGKNFIYLRKAIMYTIQKENLNITPSFEQKQHDFNKKFKKIMSARFWAVRSGKNVKKETMQKLEQDVIKYLQQTQNLEYTLKVYKSLKLYNYNAFKLKEEIQKTIKQNLYLLKKLQKKEEIAKATKQESLIMFLDVINFTNQIISKIDQTYQDVRKLKEELDFSELYSEFNANISKNKNKLR